MAAVARTMASRCVSFDVSSTRTTSRRTGTPRISYSLYFQPGEYWSRSSTCNRTLVPSAAFILSTNSRTFSRAMLELFAASALYRCGDADGLGRKILETDEAGVTCSPGGRAATTLVLTVENRPGSLYRSLEPFDRNAVRRKPPWTRSKSK